jgi:hypothetical protein
MAWSQPSSVGLNPIHENAPGHTRGPSLSARWGAGGRGGGGFNGEARGGAAFDAGPPEWARGEVYRDGEAGEPGGNSAERGEGAPRSERPERK